MKTKSSWSLFVSVLLLTFLPLFAAWSGGQKEKSAEAKPAGATVLRVWKYGSPQHEREYMLEKIRVFEQKNPDIKIDWVYQNWDDRRTQVLSANRADTLPDVLLADTQSIPEYVRMGIVKPLDDINSALVSKWKPRFVPECWNLGVYEGHVYGVAPFVDTAPMLVYNTNMFRDAGIADSSGAARPPRDWAEMVDIAAKTTKGGVFGLALPGSKSTLDTQIFVGIAYRNGGRWIDNKKVVMDGPAFVDTLDFYNKLKAHADPGYLETNFRQVMEIFFQSRTAMALTQSFAPILRQSLGAPADFPYKMASMPLREQKSGRYDKVSFIMNATVTYLVTRQAKDLEAAMRYIDYSMTQEAQEGWSGSTIEGRIPTMIANLESKDFARVYPDLAEEFKEGTLFEGALLMPTFPGFTEAERRLSAAFQEVLLGVKAPAKALADAKTDIQKIYDQANP